MDAIELAERRKHLVGHDHYMLDECGILATKVLWQDAEIKRLQLYERAMQSMAKQFVHPKMTAEELARQQLGE